MTVMLLTSFAKIEGASYLKDTLTTPIAKLVDISGHVEINPEVLERKEAGNFLDAFSSKFFFFFFFFFFLFFDILLFNIVRCAEAKENLENLVSSINIVLGHIIEEKDALPGSFRRICSHIRSECFKKLIEEGLPEDYS